MENFTHPAPNETYKETKELLEEHRKIIKKIEGSLWSIHNEIKLLSIETSIILNKLPEVF
jgi:hypothetical protein